MQQFLIISALVTTYICYVKGQSVCLTPIGSPGQCRLLTQCAPLIALVNKPDRTKADTDLLRKSHCGYQEKNIKVCCPEPCYTPDGKEGQCMNIHSCNHLVQLLKPNPPNSKVAQQVKDFVQNSRCESNDQYSVCCGPAFEKLDPAKPGQCTPTTLPPAPGSQCCGIETYIKDKIVIFGGNETGIDQYPWLALIEYKQGNKIKLLCGASLISARYVLTAGHCVAGDILNYGTPVNVRLSEHNISNDGIDCVTKHSGERECNEGTITVPIEKTIPHPDYNPYDPQKKNNIALIRLRSVGPYTVFIRPICLPTADLTVLPPPADPYKLYTAGWGKYDNYSTSDIKLFVQLPYVENSVCQSGYNELKRKITLWNGHICAGGEVDKDSCQGDSGGPLMYKNDGYYEAIGVVSFGGTPCGQVHIPGVYTKVFKYIPWMMNVMKISK